MDALPDGNSAINDTNEIKLCTNEIRQCEFKRFSNYVITPEKNDWDFKLLSILINEMRDWKLDPTNGFRITKTSNANKYFFFRYIHIDDPDSYVIIDIKDTIIVKVSRSIMEKWSDDIGVKLFHVKKYFIWKIESKGSNAILRNAPLLFYSEKDFSNIFYTFTRSFVERNIAGKTDDTTSIYDFYNSFIKDSVFEPINFEILIKKTEGYIFFHLSENNNTKKKLDSLTLGQNKYYILAATYISPFACCLVENKKVNGLMLDTTWHAIQNYVLSIPTIIIQNVGMPIGFTIALTENEKIYNYFFKRFENIFGFRISSLIKNCESDQGTALKASIEKQRMNHLVCLRHLLVSLKTSIFSEQVSNLVRAECETDLEELKKTNSDSWKTISEILKKVGLGIVKDEIKPIDLKRWRQVSMIERIKFRMPSCTNQVESVHGHLNAMVPRRNEFWRSIKRTIDTIIKKNKNFEERFKNNYAAYKRKIRNIIKHRPEDVMKSMISQYKTDAENKKCNCGEASLISAMLEVSIPCSHLVFLNVPFPNIEPPEVELDNRFEGELFYEVKIHKSKMIQTDQNYYTRIRKYATNTIKRFSHCPNKAEIAQYVKNKLQFDKTPENFVLGLPIEAITVIDNGILFFSKKMINPIKKTPKITMNSG